MEDKIKVAEKRGYSRGYCAGRRTGRKDAVAVDAHASKREFFNRALLAALPACVAAERWTNREGESIDTMKQRTELARDFAEEALRYFRG